MDRLQSLYDSLSGKYDLGSFDEFKTKLENPEKRKALYDFASNDFELGDFDSFNLKIEDSFKKKEDGESLSQEDTSVGDFGFYNKTQNKAFQDYIDTTVEKYQKVKNNDPILLAVSGNIDSEMVRTRNRILDSYIYNPDFDSNDPQQVAQANADISARLEQKYLELLNENEEFKGVVDKYNEEFLEDIQNELQARLSDEARSIADATKEAMFTSSVNPLMNIFAELSKGKGYIPIIGDAIAFQIPQAFDGWGLKNDSVKLNKITKSISDIEKLDADAPVYVNAEGELVNPAEFGGQMKRDLEQGTLPSESVNGKLMTAEEAMALLSEKRDVKMTEMKPKWEEAVEMQEFISRINQVKPISEDASFSNIMKTLTQQVPNMGVAMVMPVVGTAILEGGNTYLEQVEQIAQTRLGNDYTTDDLLEIVENGEDGAAEVTGASYVSGLLDLVGLGGIGTAISKSAKAIGKQVLKEATKKGIKKITSSTAANIGKAVLSSGLSEGITEGLQGANMQFSRINTVERATGVRPDFDFKAVLEEGAIGFLMGGLMGGGGGVVTSLRNRTKENLPESVAETVETGEKSYFDGSDAITRNQADQRIKRAKTLKELERVRVANDEPLLAKIETKRAELEKAEPVVEETAPVEEVVSEPVEEVVPEVAPEEIVAEDKPAVEEKAYTMEDVSFDDDIKSIIKSGKPGKEVLNYTDTYKDDGQDHYVYQNPESRLDVTIRKTAPQSFAVDMTVMSSDTFKTPYASYNSGPVFGTRKRAEQAALEILRNPTLLYSGVGATPNSTESELAKALVESKGIEPIVVEEAKPVKTPEMEELENEIATLQSDIETYEIEAENTQEEIDIEKGNLKDALEDIDARIKEVRASKQSAAAKRDAIEELKAEKQDVKDDNASLIEGYKEDVKNAKREAKKAATRIKRISTKLEGLAPAQPTAEPVAEQEQVTEDDFIPQVDYVAEGFKYQTQVNTVSISTGSHKRNGKAVYWVQRNTLFPGTGWNEEYNTPQQALSRYKQLVQYTKRNDYEVVQAIKPDYTGSMYTTGADINYSFDKVVSADSILERLEKIKETLGGVRTQPTKKVVGTLEVEEDVEPSITETLFSKSRALRGQVDAGVITKKEYNESVIESLNQYIEQLDAVIDDNPPVDVISADDTAEDIRAFEAQSPKLKFVSQLLSATKNFRGLYDMQDMPLRVYFYKSMQDMNEVGKAIDSREDVAAGFIDADSNRIFIAEDSLMEEATIHEFIHPIAKRIIYNNPKLATRIEQEALAIPGIKEFVEQYETDEQQEEAIVQSIALAVLDNLKKERTIPQKIKDFFMKLLRLVGFNPEVVIGGSESNLNDFIRNISEAFATGTPIKITKDLEQQSILFDINTKPAPTEEIKITESQVGQPVSKIKFSDRKELKGVKFINPKQFNGKKVVVTAYDNLKTGVVRWKNRKTGRSFTFDKKQGGPAHGFLEENKRNNVVAAFTKLNVVLKFAKAAKDAEFLLYSLMSTESSLKANKSIFQDFFGEPLEDIANEFGFETFKRDLKTVLTTKGVEKFKSDLDNITTPAELAAYVDNLTFPKRRAIFTNMFPEVKGTPTKSTIMQDKYGLPTAGEIYVMYQEEGMNNATDGDIFAASKIRPVILVNEKEYAKISKKKIGKIGEAFGIQIKQIAKESEHPAYPFAIEGEMVGMFSNLVNARDVLSYVPKDATSAYKYIEGNGPKETTTEIDEDAEVRVFDTEGTQEAVVTAAPIRVFPEFFAKKFKGKTPTVKDIVAIKNSPMFKTYRKKFIDSAKLFNITVGNITTNIGIWEGALEYSNNLEVKGTPADLKAFAAYMGLVAEPQEATIVSKAREGAESAAINIEYKSEALAQKAVDDIRAEGVVGLSYDTDRKIITIFAQEGDQNRFESYYEKNKSSIKNVEFYEADVDFISEADYEGILREYRSSEQNQGARRKDLRDAITEVLGESPNSPLLPGIAAARIKHSKSTRQNIIRPAEAIQEEFKKRLTPRRIGSDYYGKLEILTTVDIDELGLLKNPNTGATIGLDLVKEFNKVMPELVSQVMPVPKQLEPALQLADKIREALDFTTHDKVVEYAHILLASIDQDPSKFTSDKDVKEAIKSAFEMFDTQEYTESDAEFVKNNISEIRAYASEVYLNTLKNTKFSDRMSGTKYEGREALLKNDIFRSGTEILEQQRDELASAGFKNIDVSQLELTDTHMEAIAEKLGGDEEFAKILKSNAKSITNVARNDLRNKNRVAGFVESSRRYFKRGIPQKYVKGVIASNEKVLDKILAIIKPKFTETEIKVLEDYMEYSEVRKLFQTLQALQHGYLPPMAYGIIRKFETAVKAVEMAEKVGNMTIMTDANGRLIKERVAVREAKQLTTPSEELSSSEMDALQKRTTIGAMPFFKRQVDKVIPILYNQISKAFSVIESQREIDISKYNEKFAKVRTIANYEGKQYTNSDVNMLAHMYLIEKQYLANPGSNKVPKLYENLIRSIKNMNNPENKRYLELFEDFKMENNTLDIQKTEGFLKYMRAMTSASKESGMGIVEFVQARMRDSRGRVRHLQEFQNKTKVEVFDNYIYVATKPLATTGEVKANMIESLLNTDSSNTLGFAKTSISRQTYRSKDGTHSPLNQREPVFDLMFAANYSTNEVLSAYHLGEEFRNVQAQLNILAKMGDAETEVLAVALKNDIRQRIVNTFEYKMDRPTNKTEKFIQKFLSGTYTTYLASSRRFIELFSNAALVAIANPKIARAMVANYKENIGNATMSETISIMTKIGSAHSERFNKTGKAFYSAEGIGAERISGAKQASSVWDNIKKKDGQFRESYIAFSEAMNKLGEMQTGIKNFGDKIVRMSDTKIGAIAWNTVFKERFKEISGIEYSSALLTDADLFIQNRLAMKEAGNYADVFLKESFAGGAFDMNQKALKNKGTMKYLQNMFRTFRTFYYESNRNAIRSLSGAADGTMTKEEAARRLAGASAASIIYAIGTTTLLGTLYQQLFLATGLAEGEDDREWTTSAKQAVAEFILLSSIGKMPAIGYGLVSGGVRGTIRYMDQDDLNAVEAMNKFAQRLQGSNFLLRQTVPIIGEPAMLARKTIETALDAAQGELEGEDAQELFLDLLRTAVIYQGIPFTGDVLSALYTLQRMNEEGKKPKKRKKPKFKTVLD